MFLWCQNVQIISHWRHFDAQTHHVGSGDEGQGDQKTIPIHQPVPTTVRPNHKSQFFDEVSFCLAQPVDESSFRGGNVNDLCVFIWFSSLMN